MIWRERRGLLLTLGILLVVNLLFFLTYRVRYEQRVRDLDDKLEQTRAQLDQARLDHAAAQRKLEGYTKLVKDIQMVYDEWWSTPEARMTALLTEIKRLAAAAQLTPKSYSYAASKADDKMGTRSLTISFSVQGPYKNVRELINMLELSRQFVTIDSVGLVSSGASEMLNLNVQLKTIFRSSAGENNSPARDNDL